MAEAKKVAAPATAASNPAVTVNPGQLQVGESAGATITTRVPRGVDELPADHISEEPGAKALQEHVAAIMKKESDQGFRGDPGKNRTPNTAYTLAGVGRGDPTPETVVVTPSSK